MARRALIMDSMILTAGLTPAWQQIMVLDRLHQGQVNRARVVHWCASGKVLNVGLALHALGASSKTLSLVGGATGQAIRTAFRGLPCRWVESEAPTRVCTTLLDQSTNQTTELVENAGQAQPAEIVAFLAAFSEEAANTEIVVLTGSLPAGVPAEFYRRALDTFSGRAILDARGPELLEALSCRPFLVKPNREELARTFGRNELDDAELTAAMHDLNKRGAEWVVVTQGPGPVLTTNAGRRYSFALAPINRIVNPIGCGDCLAAGLADALQGGAEVIDAIRWGMACAADNLGQLLPAALDRERIATRAAVLKQVETGSA